MDTMSIVSGILATQDETRQLQIASTALNANARKNAAQIHLDEQALPANPGPGVGGNLDLSA